MYFKASFPYKKYKNVALKEDQQVMKLNVQKCGKKISFSVKAAKEWKKTLVKKHYHAGRQMWGGGGAG
jgi:hypothetical protein